MLINIENITDAEALAKYEADMTIIRQYELEIEHAVKGRFGVAHLKKIHKHIFQDIYPFAGKFRLENISKGDTDFCKSEFIKDNIALLLNALKRDDYLNGLNAGEFSKKAAYYMSEMNMIHPFREGNGRTIREFIRQLADKNGYIINWSLIDKTNLMNAIISAVGKDYGPLSTCINKAIENK